VTTLGIRLVGDVSVGCSEHHMVQEGPWVVWLEPTPLVKPKRVRCKLGETIEKPCSAWLAWRNGDVSHMETGDEITTHGECVQPLQSVKLL
jgi:hypothetical protein